MFPVRATSPSSTSDLLDENVHIRNENNYTPSGEKIKSHGVTYHDHVIMLYLCKFMLKENFNFNLTCEVEEGGKFDDIMIFYVQDNRILCRMIQVKSKTKSTSTLTRSILVDRTEPFDLNTYFLSYVEIMVKYNFERKFRCEIKDLILHTNIDVGQELKDDLEMYEDELLRLRRCYRLKDGQSDFKTFLTDQLLESLRSEISKRDGRMKVIKSKQNKKIPKKQQDSLNEEEKYVEYLKSLTRDDREKCVGVFLEKLKLHVKQPNKDELAELIKREIKRCLKKYKLETIGNSNQSVIVYTGLYNKVYTFHSDPKVTVLTNRQLVDWLKQASRGSMTRLAAFHDMNMNLLTSHGFLIRRESVKRLKANIERSNEQFLNVIANAGTVFTLIKLNEIFRGKKYNLITEHQFLSMSSTIEDDIEIERTEHLIITCDDNITTDLLFNIEDLLDRIRDESESVCEDLKKIILVSKSGENHPNDMCTIITDRTEWNDLERDTRRRIERENTICLQGREVKLADVDISNFSDLLNDEILYDVVYSTVTLGRPIDSENTCDISNYIERRVSLRNKISENVFKVDSKNDVFIVSNMNETEFQQLKSTSRCHLVFANVANSRNLFVNLCSEQERGNVTLLRHEDGEFFCQDSKSTDRLLPYVNGNSPRSIELHRLTAINNRIVLIVAESGMGKSDLMTVLASRMIKETPRTLVVKINLNNCTKEFSRLLAQKRTFTEQSDAVDFIVDTQLYNTEGYRNTFERNYFKRHFNLSEGVFVLLDGFDEIAPDYREIVIDLINLIKDISSVRLWLTSRPQEKKYLETELNTLSYALVRFTAEDQNNFFLTYWNRHGTDDQNARLKKFVERLINVTSKSLRDDDQLMTGIPLQCRMLGEVYQGTFDEYFNSEQDDLGAHLPESLDILELYDKFIEKKRIIYEEEKLKRDRTILGNRILSLKDSGTFNKIHSYFGLYAVFMKAYLDDILSEKDRKKMDKYTREVESGNEKTGIIHIVDKRTPAFIHKTFAEFFAARWFYYRIKSDGPDRQRLVEFFKKHFFKSEFEMVRRFFDRLSANGEIFKAILNNDGKSLMKMLETDSVLVDSRADFDRNPLHLCAAYEYNNLICILIEKRVQSTTVDSLCGWKPIEYACAVKNWKNVDTFLGFDADDATVYKCMKDKNILFHASKNSYVHLVQYLIKHGSSEDTTSSKNDDSSYLSSNEGVLIGEDRTPNVNTSDADGDTVLHYAARTGNLDIVKLLINSDVDPNVKNNMGDTPMHLAANNGHYEVIKYLMEVADAACDFLDNDGDTVLHYAARGGNIDIVKLLIKADADPNFRNNKGCSPVFSAAYYGHYEIFKYLIEVADGVIDILDRDDDSVLHYAARGGNVDIVKLLIEAKMDPNTTNKNGLTPLHSTANSGHCEVFKYLIQEAGAAIDRLDNDGDNVLHYAARGGNVDIVKMLIQATVDPNIENHKRCTPLHLAAFHGHYEIIKYLIEDADAATDVLDSDGDTVLHHATRGGNVDIVKLLIKARVDTNVTNNGGCSCLHLAAKNGNYETFRYLIRNTDAAIDVVDNDGDTVLHYAARGGSVDIAKLLINVGVDPNTKNNSGYAAVNSAAYHSNYETVKYLIEDGNAAIDIRDKDGDTVLHYASRGGNVDIVKVLIKAGVDPNITTNKGCTVLHSAAFHGKCEIVKYLMEDTDAAIDTLDSDGDNVLHYAARGGNVDIVRLLIEAHFDPNIANNAGGAPIHLAVNNGHSEIVRCLIEDSNTRIDIRDNDGDTALLYACRKGNMNIVKLLIKAGADPNIRNNLGCVPLFSAAQHNYYEIFKCLLEVTDAATDIRDNDDDNVLHYAARGGTVGIIKLLIEAKIDPNVRSKNGRVPLHSIAFFGYCAAYKYLTELADTAIDVVDNDGDSALHYAARGGNLEIVKALIQAGIDPSIKNNKRCTPLHLAAFHGHYELTKYLMQEADAATDIIDSDEDTVLHWAARGGSLDTVKLLIGAHVDPNIKNNDGCTSLHLAAKSCHYEVFRYLMENAGASIDMLDNDGDTVLHYAARGGNLDIVKLLVGAGLDPNVKNNSGNTAVNCAAYYGHDETIKYLIEDCHAASDLLDNDGDTVLHYAARGGKGDVVKLLIRTGVDINIKNNKGRTPMHVAVHHGYYEILKHLTEVADDAANDIPDSDENI